MNVQDGNVGNRGDIFKHAALVRLAQLMRRRNEGRIINYLDTHAYRLQGVLSAPDWPGEVAGLSDGGTGYEAYQRLEQPYVNNGVYLCSVGLARRCLPRVRLYLSEANPETRTLLSRQLAAAGDAGAEVRSDVLSWAADRRVWPSGPLLALVDPFTLTDAVWQGACAAIGHLHGSNADGVLEVFTYNRDQNIVDWPDPPGGWNGPIGCLFARPYFLAVYATPSIAAQAQAELAALNWALVN